MSWTPCGKCLNCRNGYPYLCLKNATPPKAKAVPRVSGNTCNECGKPVSQRMRYCVTCRRLRRKAAYRRINRKRQNEQVRTTTVKAFSA